MNYELAKKLKDAGFPQTPVDVLAGYDGYYNGGKYLMIGREVGEGGETYLTEWEYQEALKRGDLLTKYPSLSELIEKCFYLPEGFVSLTAPKITCEGDEFGVTCGWIAIGYSVNQKIEILATNPEEAVAKLWLKLNAK